MARTEEIVNRLLGEADTLLLGLLKNALIGVYVIQDNCFIFTNQRIADIFGYSQEDLCSGMGPLDLTASADHHIVQGEIDRRVEGGAKESFYRFRGARKDGALLDIEVFGVTSHFEGRPAIVGMLLDVTERSTAERAVADQLRFIAQLVDTIPSPVFYKDEKGRYLGCNAAFEQFIGVTRVNLVGKSVYDISPPDLADKYFAADMTLFNNPGKQTYEAAVSYADGSRHDVVFYKATFNKADGDLGGLVGVILDISERKRMEDAIWREANYDALTGLPNRRLFRDRLGAELERAQRETQRVAILFIDLDRFKEVNDTLGHDIGDLLLIEAGERIAACLRKSDTVSRLGGDEFTAMLSNIYSKDIASRAAQKIIHALAQPFQLEGRQAYVSASIGIAYYPCDSTDPDALVSYADQAMYAAKSHGRNGFCYFSPAMQSQAQKRLEMSNDLRRAVIEEQFEVYYQPIVDMAELRVVKAEALIRWHHPRLGMVGPAEFIAVAEDIGIINDIGNWVFHQVAATALRWKDMVPKVDGNEARTRLPIQISLNISPRQFIAGSCSSAWIDYLRRLDLPSQLLSIEITEGLLLDQRPAVVETLLAFRDAGIQVSIDDFGTGYSAMSYLKKFDVDYLKIDRSFISDLTTDPSDLAIAEAVIAMAHKLGIMVIAEGVETQGQCDLLQQAGCDFAQGYLFSKPVPATEFQRLFIEG